MRVRIDRDVAKKVKAAMKKSGRSAAREVSMALAEYYHTKALADGWFSALNLNIPKPPESP